MQHTLNIAKDEHRVVDFPWLVLGDSHPWLAFGRSHSLSCTNIWVGDFSKDFSRAGILRSEGRKVTFTGRRHIVKVETSGDGG